MDDFVDFIWHACGWEETFRYSYSITFVDILSDPEDEGSIYEMCIAKCLLLC
jgi:hypothetical protein